MFAQLGLPWSGTLGPRWHLISFPLPWEAVTVLLYPISPVAFGKVPFPLLPPSEYQQELYLLRVFLPILGLKWVKSSLCKQSGSRAEFGTWNRGWASIQPPFCLVAYQG